MKPRIHRIIAITAAFAGLSLPAFAASGNWNTTTSGALWTLNTNWVGNVIADGSGSTADFSQVDLTADTAVSLSGGRTIGNLIFGDTNISTPGSWTLNGGGGALTLAGGTPSITVNALGSGKLVTLNASLAGTSGFTKNGTGTLTLAGGASNTLSGPIIVNSGMLGSLDSVSLQNITSAITVASGATFDAKAGFGASIANSFILSGTGFGIYNYGALNIRENANLTGTITLTADAKITHDWNIATVSGSITGTNTNLELQTLQAGQYGFVMNSPISLGTGALTLTGIGTSGSPDFTLSGTNSYTGGTLLKGGRVSFNNASALGNGTVTFVSDTSLASTANMTLANAITVNSGVAATLDVAASTTLVQSGAVTGDGTLTKSGLGTATLSGGTSNTLSGAISVSAGRLGSLNSASLQNITGAITVAPGATFDAKANFGGNITNSFILSGTGSGINNYGALNIRENANLTGAITLTADTLITHDWNVATVSGSITGTNTNLELKTLQAGQYGFFVSAPISLGTGSLKLTGIGTSGSPDLTLSGTNSWSAMVIEKGVVYFSNSAAMGGTGANITIGTVGVAVLDGAAISELLSRVNTASTGAIAFSSSSTDNIDLTSYPSLSVGSQVSMVLSGTITPGGGSYRLGGGGNTLTVSSALSGSSGLVVHDAQGGTIVLSSGHTYSGPTTITAGTLQVDGSLSGAVTVASAGTLTLGAGSGIGSLTLASPLTVAGKLSFRIDRSNSQNADLITAPSLALTGVLSVSNIGPALQSGDSFKLFDISGSFTQSQVTFILPTLSPGLTWDAGSLLATGTLKVAVVTNTIGDPNFPQLLPAQLQAVRDAGYSSATINPGTYQMPDTANWLSSFQWDSWCNFTLNANNVVLVVGKQRAFTLSNCSNVTIKGLTVQPRYPSFTQGRVLEKGIENGIPFAVWRISDGYPENFNWWFNAVDQTTREIDLETGDLYYNSADATYLSDRKWKLRFPGKTSLPFSINDWLVTRIPDGQSFAIFLNDCTNCTIDSVSSQSGGFATFFEVGGGGNHLLNSRIETSPALPPGATELPIVSCAADGVHTVDTYPGMHIENCVFTGVFLDDNIAIHGHYRSVLSATGNTIICDGAGKFKIGDPIRISTDNGFFNQAICMALEDLGGGNYRLTMDQSLSVPAGAKISNPKYNGDGFRIINCQLGNTRSRIILTKADNGTISGCTLQNSGTAIKIGPEYYWNESDYCWNVTIENNIIAQCALGIQVAADGTVGNKDIFIRNNTIGTITQSYGISLDGCDGATISGNSFATPTAAESIRLNNSTNITLANNLVAYAPNAKAVLSVGSNVTAVQGAANGILYSGRAYAFSNSLSGLLLAHPSSNAVGALLQQYSNSNASSRWTLQPDGNGYCKIVSAANGLVAGVNQSTSSAAPLILETSGPGLGQRWTLTPLGTSAVKLVNRLSGLAATVQTWSLSETITQLADTSAAGQLWTPAQDDPPVATAQSVITAEDTAKAITLAGTDLQGSPLTYTIVTQPAGGLLSGPPPESDLHTRSQFQWS